MIKLFKKVLGQTPEAQLKKLQPIVEKIEGFEDYLQKQDDNYFAARIKELSQDLKHPDITDKDLKKKLDQILPEVFAIVRESSKRVLGLRHYPVQLIGGIVLHQNNIAEMKTGEGKTLVATCPAVLNAMTGRGVHIVTVNDYLASRDSEWMGRVYKFLGLSVGLIVPQQNFEDKQKAYQSDILYATNNELGFDYLRDNMASSLGTQVRRQPYYAIVDEVDSVLIDEARTPLIISGSPESSKQQIYLIMNKLSQQMKKGASKDDERADYYLEEKNKNAILTDTGIKKAEETLGIDDLWDIRANLAHHLLQALKAKEFFVKDSDYVVNINPENGHKEVVIVDEFTGRLMNGRRWSDGLHQAVEAKENVPIQEESLTLASITFQNFFRLYPKLAGMTGTALTEEEEFKNIYNLSVIPIPTNRPNARNDKNDKIYKNQDQKYYAILEEIIQANETGRPILVGTTNIEKSELISSMLSKPKASVDLLKWRAKRLITELEGKHASADKLIKNLKKAVDRPVNIKYQSIRELLEAALEDTEQVNLFSAELSGAIKGALDNLTVEHNDKDITMFFKTFLSSCQIVSAIRKGIKHNILNAKQHAKEAEIIAQAGRISAITIATNMAGRGTDIMLGGNAEFLAHAKTRERKLEHGSLEYDAAYNEALSEIKPKIEEEHNKVVELGGLHIIGTERHESRRIDNQLRGRAGRQGDPGSTSFFLALDDQLMRIFGGDRLATAMNFFKTEEDIAIEDKLINRGIENAQKKVEAHNFEIRKRLLEYDDVSNIQRGWVYGQRQRVLEGYNLTETFEVMLSEQIERIVYTYLNPERPPETWYEPIIPEDKQDIPPDEISEEEMNTYPKPIQMLLAGLFSEFQHLDENPYLERLQPELFEEYSFDELLDHIKAVSLGSFNDKANDLGPEIFQDAQRFVFLKAIDDYWVEHLQALDSLKAGIHLRGYGNKQPIVEYKKEAFEMFDNQLYNNIRRQAIQWVFHIQRVEIEENQKAVV